MKRREEGGGGVHHQRAKPPPAKPQPNPEPPGKRKCSKERVAFESSSQSDDAAILRG